MGLFSIMGRLGLDTSDFQAGIKRAESATTGFANKLSGDIRGKIAGAFTVAAVAAWSKSVSDHYGKVADLADAYRITTEQVQKMQAAEMLNGQEMGSLANVMTKLQEARQKAVAGDEKMIGVYKRMGLSLNDLKSDSVDAYSVLEKVGSALSSRPDSSQAQADFLDLAGTKAAKLLKAVQDINNEPPVTIIKDAQVRAISDAGDRLDVILANLRAISAISFINVTNAMDDIAGVAGDIWGIITNPSSWTSGGENSLSILKKIVENRIALNKAIREGPGPEPVLTDRQRWGSEWADIHTKGWRQVEREMMAAKWSKSGQLFGSDNPLFSMEGRDTGEMFGPMLLPGMLKQKATSNMPEFRSNAAGALQSMGGYWFGAEDSSKQDLAAMRADIKRIADSVNKVATQ
jgi:hypothetical protein